MLPDIIQPPHLQLPIPYNPNTFRLSHSQMAESVVLYTSPGMGHLVSAVELGKLILQHHPYFNITVLLFNAPFYTGATAEYTASVSAEVPAIKFHRLPDVTLPPEVASMPLPDLLYELPRFQNPNLHDFLVSLPETSKPNAFVLDFFNDDAFEVTDKLNIPTYYYYTTSASSLASLLYLPTLHEKYPGNLSDLKVPIEFPGLPPFPARQMPIYHHDRNSWIHNRFLKTGRLAKKAAGMLVNTFDALERSAIKAISDGLCLPDGPTPPLYCMGPLMAPTKDAPHECLTWLSSQPSKSVVFLCFGSWGSFPLKQLREIAVGLENSGQRFLWVVRNPPTDGGNLSISSAEPNLEELLPEGFLERTKHRGFVVKSWAPQKTILGHDSVGGFVSHCGWNSTLEAVAAGVPMVTWPLYAEQSINKAFLVGEAKVALPLGDSEDGFVDAAELEDRVRELMDSERGKELRKRMEEMRDEAVAALKEGGSSLKALARVAAIWRQR